VGGVIGAVLAVAVAAAYGVRLHRRRSPRPARPGGAAAESEAARAEADRISGSAADDLARLRLRSARGAAEPNPAFDADGQPEYETVLPDGAGGEGVSYRTAAAYSAARLGGPDLNAVGGVGMPPPAAAEAAGGLVLGPAYENFRPGVSGAGGERGSAPAVALDAEGYVVADAVRQDHGTGYSSMAAYASAAAAADPAVDSRA